MHKKPCSICRKWFTPDRRIGARQRTCSKRCSEERRRRKQAEWRRRNPEYFKARWLKERSRRAEEADRATAEALKEIKAGREPPPDESRPRRPSAIRVGGELGRLPWEAVQSEIGLEVTDFIAVVARLLIRLMQSEMGVQIAENKRVRRRLQEGATQTQIHRVPGW
jgi:hypothetical protein